MPNNRMPKCQCVGCNNIGIYAAPVRRRGGGNAFLCERHKTYLHGYSDENPRFIGTPKAHGLTISHELETMNPSFYGRLELLLQGYLPTHDGTVDVEFKSSISYGLNIVSAYAETIEYLMNSGDITLDENCGLHTHFGHKYLNSATMAYIRRFYHSLFVPVMTAWENDREKHCRLFGRYAAGWAMNVTSERRRATTHENAINVQHEPTIEFRSPRFQTANQYIAVVNYLKRFMLIVIDTYIPALVEAGLIEITGDSACATQDIYGRTEGGFCMGVERLTETQRNILKKAVDKTAKKLVKQWESLDVSEIHWSGEAGGSYDRITVSF